MSRFSDRLLGASTATMLLIGVATAKETIVFVRHGEKPPQGLGQFDCRGLNRALALPTVIQKSFGKPDAIFAPNPSDQKNDEGEHYDYVRPLATIEPTAIAFGMPSTPRSAMTMEKASEKRSKTPRTGMRSCSLGGSTR